ncbi:MAG: arginine deiminase [Spirochaetia bacterium]
MGENLIHVYSEIGKLKKVLLHRPGRELENLVPKMLGELLFDDTPYLKKAQEEHDCFADTLRKSGTEVLYVENLLAQALSDPRVKESFVGEFIHEANISSKVLAHALKDFLLKMPTAKMVDQVIAGLRKGEFPAYQKHTLSDHILAERVFYLDPMPNLLFMRDPFAAIGRGVNINSMHTRVRQRETLLLDYIFKYHPVYAQNVPRFHERTFAGSLEGGDQLVINENILAIGISQRTQAVAIENVARNLFSSPGNTFKQVVAIDIPDERAFMHLDTVFTQVDHDKFSIFSHFDRAIRAFVLTPAPGDYGLKVREEVEGLDTLLSNLLERRATLISCGNGDPVDSDREQWNDGSNTLAIAPGEVVVYDRNHVTNALLEDHGIKVHRIPSSELSRGRGGPRCMSMPLSREQC